MLTSLNLEKKTQIFDYCKERFDISKKIFDNYNWYLGSKNRIFIGPDKIERINPESIGICVFRLNKTPKPTTNFLQLFGNQIYKNVIELNKKQTTDYCNGLNLEPETDVKPGFVIVKYKKNTLGCGHWNGNLLKNQIPKSRFCKINYL